MWIAILGGIAGLCTCVLLGMFIRQNMRISRGEVIVSDVYVSGPDRVRETVHALLRLMMKRSVLMRKLCMQYMLHILVRMAFYLDKVTAYIYAHSRNKFIRQAVKDKSTVGYFWEYLKVYKQEIDAEKEEQ